MHKYIHIQVYMNINRNDQDIVRRILQVPFNANTWKLSRHGQDMVRYILIVLFLMLICENLSRHSQDMVTRILQVPFNTWKFK